MSNHFRYYLRVRYAECDGQKVVFNSRYGDYIDLAGVEFFRTLGFGEALINGDLDYQLVKQTIEWRSSAQFDQVLEVSVWIERVGNTSFTMNTAFRIAGNEPVICNGETIYVLVQAETLTKKPISADLRAALEAGAPGKHVDHAAYLPGAISARS